MSLMSVKSEKDRKLRVVTSRGQKRRFNIITVVWHSVRLVSEWLLNECPGINAPPAANVPQCESQQEIIIAIKIIIVFICNANYFK